jgi:hypothetical protein
MRSSPFVPLCGAVLATVGFAALARADYSNDFSTNPIGRPGVTVQGPDAANVNTRFTYNGADGTLTAHYNTTAPTIKLLFPLGQQFTQNTSFTFSSRLEVLSSGLNSPPDFGGEVVCFGLLNSSTTGSTRASTGHYDSSFNFVEDTPGNSYDLMTFDYFPTQDNTFGGNSLDLTTVQSAQAGHAFDSQFFFGYTNATLPLDQFLTVKVTYDADTKVATLDYGSGTVTSNLAGAAFSADSLGITLWSDPNLNPAPPADPSGSPVAVDVVFDSISAAAVPEPGTLALLGAGVLLLNRRRRAG